MASLEAQGICTCVDGVARGSGRVCVCVCVTKGIKAGFLEEVAFSLSFGGWIGF